MANFTLQNDRSYANFRFFCDHDFNESRSSLRIETIVKTQSSSIHSEHEESSILKRIAADDPRAVQDCLNRYSGLVWSLARKMIGNREEAEDAVQEIFIEIWKNAERFDETQASETTFVAMIARRRLIDRLRKIKRQPNIDSFEDIVIEPANKANEFMQINIEAKQAAEVFTDLKPEQRNILHLSIVEGYSHSEIADALSLPLGTVKTHARRGLIEVRKSLDSKKFSREVRA